MASHVLLVSLPPSANRISRKGQLNSPLLCNRKMRLGMHTASQAPQSTINLELNSLCSSETIMPISPLIHVGLLSGAVFQWWLWAPWLKIRHFDLIPQDKVAYWPKSFTEFCQELRTKSTVKESHHMVSQVGCMAQWGEGKGCCGWLVREWTRVMELLNQSREERISHPKPGSGLAGRNWSVCVFFLDLRPQQLCRTSYIICGAQEKWKCELFYSKTIHDFKMMTEYQ